MGDYGLVEMGIREVDVAVWEDPRYRHPFYSCDKAPNLNGKVGVNGKTIAELREAGIIVRLVTSEHELRRVKLRFAAKPGAPEEGFMNFQQSRIVPLSLEERTAICCNQA